MAKKQLVHLLSSKSQSEITRFLKIDVQSLTDSQTLISAITSRAKTQFWNLYPCPNCDLSFNLPLLLSEHVIENHINFNAELNNLIPNQADKTAVEALLNESWDPLEFDSERGKIDLLSGIRSSIQKLADYNVLAETHINIMFKIAGVSDFTQRSNLCLRSLNASKLNVLVTLLEGLISECCKDIEEGCARNQEAEMEKIFINGDGSMIVLNANQFSEPKVDALVSWLYDEGPSSENALSRWNELKTDRQPLGKEVVDKIREECEQLETICIKKHNTLRYKSAVETLERVFLDLVVKTDQSQEAVMRKLRGDLAEMDGKDNDVLRHVAANVQKEAESLRKSKMRNLVKLAKQKDNSAVEAFRKQIRDSDFEETKCDAKLLRKIIDIRHLRDKLELACALDYRTVVMSLVKDLLRRRLEDEAELNAAAAASMNITRNEDTNLSKR